MTALAIIDLPEPDSPTTQRISLDAIDSETSLHRMRPVGAAGQADAEMLEREDRLCALIGPSASD